MPLRPGKRKRQEDRLLELDRLECQRGAPGSVEERLACGCKVIIHRRRTLHDVQGCKSHFAVDGGAPLDQDRR